MAISVLRLIKRCAEELPKSEIKNIPWHTRGIYVLLKRKRYGSRFDVGYVGMSRGERGGVASRLWDHARRKGKLWTHFSVFEVHDNIHEEEVEELEGLFRHIYRKDTRANPLNEARGYDRLRSFDVCKPNLHDWWQDTKFWKSHKARCPVCRERSRSDVA